MKYRVVTINQLYNENLILLRKGKMITKAKVGKGNIPVIAGGKTSPYSHNKFTHRGNIITISSSGAYSGYIWYHSYPIWASDCNVLYSNNEKIILTKYLYHVLYDQQTEIYKLQHGTGQPHIYSSDLKNLLIPLPPLYIQQQIVDMLEYERKLIEAQEKVQQYFESKIQNKLKSIWHDVPQAETSTDKEQQMIETQNEIITYFEQKMQNKLDSIWHQVETKE